METRKIELENTSSHAQKVWVPDETGTQRVYTLEPYDVRHFEEDVADAFLKERGQWVRKFAAAEIPSRPGEAKVWIANMTGNPFLPDEVSIPIKNHITKLVENVKIANPLKTPTVMRRRMHTSQVTVKGTDGEETLNFPAVDVVIPPFQRHRVPESVASWLMTREGQQLNEYRGRLMVCREPSDFEPNESWSLDELRTYAAMVNKVEFDIVNRWPSEKAYEKPEEVEKARANLLQALFFKIVDPTVALPPKAAFKQTYSLMIEEGLVKHPQDKSASKAEPVKHTQKPQHTGAR